MPAATPLPRCPDLAQHELREHATTLRREADAIDTELRALQTFDRPDVWQGARASAFREGLEDHVRLLSTPASGLTDALREAAARIERRADELGRAAPDPTHAAVPPALRLCPPS